MNLPETLIESLDRYMDGGEIQERLRAPLDILGEEAEHFLPSIELAGDGPSLSRILLVSPSYMCDVSMSSRRAEFDFIDRDTVVNYRFNFWTHDLKEENVVKSTLQLAQISLIHEIPWEQFTTQLDYAGDERDGWLQAVLRAIPLRRILRRSRKAN